MDKKWWLLIGAVAALLVLGLCVAVVLAGGWLMAGRAAAACSDGSLTPEEKANCGLHAYQLDEKLTSYCSKMTAESGARTVSTRFSGDAMTTSLHNWPLTRIATDAYEAVLTKPYPSSNINRHAYTIKFNMNGFTENYAYEGPQGTLIDCWLDTYTLSK